MLWLIGMMGSGKSTVGVEVASRLGLDFVDTDLLVASVTDSSIADLWAAEGEHAFRRLENEMITSAASGEPVVVATGGGAVLDPGNIDLMRSSGLVIWLEASPETLAARVGSDGSRPLVADADDPVQALAELLESRRDQYVGAAHHRIPTDGRETDEIAEQVIELWNRS
ncbi:MAG TPA: shikimate kinase [Acidimicrobiia bacterium]|nr:shikimate kinase [Acidimicrobiia bacterium]